VPVKRILAIFFLFIFTLQVMPAKAIGKLMSKAQTEDTGKQTCDCDDDDDAGFVTQYDAIINHAFNCVSFTGPTITMCAANRHYTDDLLSDHVTDIPCPPPNF
jgi:hypothetical protein